jgi:hypothetical protein
LIWLQLEHNAYLSYPKVMIRRFSRFFAYLLLVLIPLQGFAAANMSVCNSMMQLTTESKTESKVSVTPCHQNMHMASMAKTQDSSAHKSTCKTNCAALCASLSGITAITQTSPAMPVLVVSQISTAYSEAYISYTPPSLQRPPNFLS